MNIEIRKLQPDLAEEYAHFFDETPHDDHNANVKVKSIFCYVVAPDMKKNGIATRLVEYVCNDATADGFDFVEAYPNVEYTPLDCRGPLAMYEKCGFSKSTEREGRVVVRKALK